MAEGSLCPGCLLEGPTLRVCSASCLHPSCSPAPQGPHREALADSEHDTRPQGEALLCIVSHYGLACWTHLLDFLQTLTLVWSHMGKSVTRWYLQPAFQGQIPSKSQATHSSSKPQWQMPQARPWAHSL